MGEFIQSWRRKTDGNRTRLRRWSRNEVVLFLLAIWIMAFAVMFLCGEIVLGQLAGSRQASWAKAFNEFADRNSPAIRDAIQAACIAAGSMCFLLFWIVCPAAMILACRKIEPNQGRANPPAPPQ